ncbi:CoA ester lyase [Aestuariicella hydrocarbonica]|uniref:CoA ester lyase n=1 Tax=Pseudomaricurvus hydrocarbonicus TaxID=1470433 RepID=A0A9E5T1C7_9GAMM|nr:CoA ester lyase [Aestuariicella hydrocarbonica]NHO67230.1 CoA ester lyase [Aestuariicella hydrocarbonica]
MTYQPRRSLLFVPGNRPERFTKAIATGADMVCIDLEDAVLPADKVQARSHVLAFLRQPGGACQRVVRVNQVSSMFGIDDLQAIAADANQPDIIMLPKVESPVDIERAESCLGSAQIPLIALIESPRGLLNADAIAAASPNVTALMFGGADFSAELGGDMSWQAMYHARSHLSTVASAHGMDVIDVPFLDVHNQNGLREECQRIRSMGFNCKSAIHPAQIDVIHEVFTPSETQIEKAKRIVREFENSQGGAVLVDGKLVDRPIILLAEKTLAMAKALQLA